MNELGGLFEGYSVPSPQKTKINSERAELISKFVEKINLERKGTIYKPISPRGVAMKLSHLKNNMELHFFYKLCDNSKSGFGRCFFGALKARDNPPSS